MMKKVIIKLITTTLVLTFVGSTLTANAAAEFDPSFYATTYADVVNALGTEPQALYNHYLTYGQKEGRKAYKGANGGETVSGIKATTEDVIETEFTPVALKDLANYKSLKKKMTDEEFAEAYNVAVSIVTPLADKSREEQIIGIAMAIRERFDTGKVIYTTSLAHYNDPYGYLVSGVGSCAGCARATGLCLNILGIDYEHVNENQWSHQWCRVKVGDTYWICDAYGLTCGPEPAPYCHPYL